jgi:hypothetical protein
MQCPDGECAYQAAKAILRKGPALRLKDALMLVEVRMFATLPWRLRT